MVFISSSLAVTACEGGAIGGIWIIKEVTLRSEISWTKAAPCLHIPRFDSDFETEFWGSPFRWNVLDQRVVLPWRKRWYAAGESFDSSSVLSFLICKMGFLGVP